MAAYVSNCNSKGRRTSSWPALVLSHWGVCSCFTTSVPAVQETGFSARGLPVDGQTVLGRGPTAPDSEGEPRSPSRTELPSPEEM